MRLEAEFTSEPFLGEGSPPEHAVAARDAAAEAGLDTDFGPLGTLARGDAKDLLEALPAIAQAALDGGATRITLQVRRPDDAGSAAPTDSGSGTTAKPANRGSGPDGAARNRTGEPADAGNDPDNQAKRRTEEPVGTEGRPTDTAANRAGNPAGTGQGPTSQARGRTGEPADTGQDPASQARSRTGVSTGTGQGPTSQARGQTGEPTDTGQDPASQARGQTGEPTSAGTGPTNAVNSPASGPNVAERGPAVEANVEGAPVVELHDALARLIADVERELGGKLGDLDRPDKQRAVRLLRERGAFGLRKSVSAVADALGVTRFTVYNYLNREAD